MRFYLFEDDTFFSLVNKHCLYSYLLSKNITSKTTLFTRHQSQFIKKQKDFLYIKIDKCIKIDVYLKGTIFPIKKELEIKVDHLVYNSAKKTDSSVLIKSFKFLLIYEDDYDEFIRILDL